MNFTAIDFETAHPKRWSICQVGLVKVESGVVTAELDLLVQPPNNEVWARFTDIHGIHWQDTIEQPTFDLIWPQVLPYIDQQVVVAHNMSFDGSCLHQVLDYYGIPQPRFQKQCTYRIFGKALNVLCAEHDISLDHHNALSDARACAELYLRHLSNISMEHSVNIDRD